MFEIEAGDDGTIWLRGRFDAAQVETAKKVLDSITESRVVDFRELNYISSGGLGLLFSVQRKLVDRGHGLRLVNLSPHLREIFVIAEFDRIFEIG
jgi:anti-sigma B factor antagonist